MSSPQVGRQLAVLARMLGQTQSAIADKCGMSRISVNRFFTGKTEVRASDFVKILKCLGIEIEEQIEFRLEKLLRGQATNPSSVLSQDLAEAISCLEPRAQKSLIEQMRWWVRARPDQVRTEALQRIDQYMMRLRS